MVAADHIAELVLGVLVGLGILPRDGPVDGNLRPYQDAHFLCLAYHLLVVGIVGETYEITTQFLCPSKKCPGILGRVGPSATVRFLVVNGDSFQEDGLSVEQDLFVAGLNGAEAYFVGKG